MLVAAMNPCACGFRGDKTRACRCPAHRLAQYAQRLSGPLLDRIDLRIDVPRLTPHERRDGPGRNVGGRARACRARQSAAAPRLAGAGVGANAHLSARALRDLCHSTRRAVTVLDRAYEELRLSARACDRVIKVAQTIADLEDSDVIHSAHVLESLTYREPPWSRR